MVPISKPDGRICICIDFHDLNKVCPKDDFSLPNINILFKNTIEYNILSIMDGFLGYNQIWVNPNNQHKIDFTIPLGTYCYRFMTFDIKNSQSPLSKSHDIHLSRHDA